MPSHRQGTWRFRLVSFRTRRTDRPPEMQFARLPWQSVPRGPAPGRHSLAHQTRRLKQVGLRGGILRQAAHALPPLAASSPAPTVSCPHEAQCALGRSLDKANEPSSTFGRTSNRQHRRHQQKDSVARHSSHFNASFALMLAYHLLLDLYHVHMQRSIQPPHEVSTPNFEGIRSWHHCS